MPYENDSAKLRYLVDLAVQSNELSPWLEELKLDQEYLHEMIGRKSDLVWRAAAQQIGAYNNLEVSMDRLRREATGEARSHDSSVERLSSANPLIQLPKLLWFVVTMALKPFAKIINREAFRKRSISPEHRQIYRRINEIEVRMEEARVAADDAALHLGVLPQLRGIINESITP